MPDQTWRALAACPGQPPDYFIHDLDAVGLAAIGKQICATCPVQGECLGDQLSYEQAAGAVNLGVFGGTTPSERRAFHRATGILPAPGDPGGVPLPFPKNGMGSRHGSEHAYRVHGCRCEKCTTANQERNLRLKLGRPQQVAA